MKRALTPDRDQGPDWESRVADLARRFEYPPTPDLTTGWPREGQRHAAPPRRARWVLVGVALAVLLFVIAALTVPEVRAAVRNMLRLGGVTIFLDERHDAPPPPLRLPDAPPAALAGETTLAAARASVPFALRLPTYPPDLGPPDRVFLQELDGPLVILVWSDPEDPARARLALHIMGPSVYAQKGNVQSAEPATVNGSEAVWVVGTHMLEYVDPRRPSSSARGDLRRVVSGHVLIWQEGRLTYRLETDWPKEEAVRVAESLD